MQVRDVVFHVFQDFVGGIALHDLFYPPAAVVVEAHVHHVRVAEQVVQVAERFLVGAHQEGGQVILVLRGDRVQLERFLDVTLADEAVYLPAGGGWA